MTSPFGNLAFFLLFLRILLLLQPFLFTQAASTAPPVTRQQITFMIALDDDFDDDDDDDLDNNRNSPPPEVVKPRRTTLLRTDQKPQFCPYDSCSEDQEPCAHLSEKTGCLCPGVSRADQPPYPPRIKELQPVGEGVDRGKIEVKWCAPSSVVSAYRVSVDGRGEDALEFQNTLRRGLVGSLEVGTKVCVEAVNSAGSSTRTELSCQRYERPERSTDNVSLAWLIGGVALLVLLVIVAAVVLWRYRLYRKAKRDSADGLGNPSYSTEATL